MHAPTKPSLTEVPGIRGVIFDFGGVLIDMRWDVSAGLEDAHGLPRHALLETLYRTPTWREIERGQGDLAAWRDDAHRLLEERAGHSLPRLHDAWVAARHLIRANISPGRAAPARLSHGHPLERRPEPAGAPPASWGFTTSSTR